MNWKNLCQAIALLCALIAKPIAVQGANHQVLIVDYAFSPANLTINPGDTVTWVMRTTTPHTTRSDTLLWDSGRLAFGTAGFSRTFNTAGTFPYNCEYHSSMMRGTITVSGGPQGTTVNLAPYNGPIAGIVWADALVASSVFGDFVEANPLSDTQDVFVSWAIQNKSVTQAASQTFFTHILVDGVLKTNWLRAGIALNTFNSEGNLNIGRLSAGNHTLRMVIDATGAVAESDEVDNVYERTITVAGTGGGGGTEHQVSITDSQFTPANLTIQPGDRVTWRNNGQLPHTSSGNNNVWESGTLNPGQSFTRTFPAVGTFGYRCLFHFPFMTGTITVSGGQQGTTANLAPYNGPIGGVTWAGSLVASSVLGDYVETNPLRADQDVYLSWAIQNKSVTRAASEVFHVNILVDGASRTNWLRAGLALNTFNSGGNFNIGKLSAGTHTLRMVIDMHGAVAESDETDNIFERTITVNATPQANTVNLVPFKREDWAAVIVASALGDYMESNPLSTSHDVYLSWAVANISADQATALAFSTHILVDGVLKTNWVRNGLPINTYNSGGDFNIGKLSAGKHVLRMVVDAGSVVAESNETDNTFERTITVPTTGGGGSTEYEVLISNFAFVPATLNIKVGDKVTWRNQDQAPHTATSNNTVWDSGVLNQNQNFSFTFTSAGTFPYFCAVHPTMKAAITVGAPPINLGSVQLQPGLGLRFTAIGQAGFTYAVETSSDLARWDELFRLPNTTGTLSFTDREALTLSRRFYRVRQVGP